MTAKKAGGAADEFFDIIKTIVYALLIALVLRIVLFQPFTIPSESMKPNLLAGDYIIVTKYSYGYSKHSIPFSPPLGEGRLFGRAPTRGDVVVFKDTKDNRTDYIKRLIGLPGDRIRVTDGILYINDNPVEIQLVDQDLETVRSGGAVIEETLSNARSYLTLDTVPSGRGDNTNTFLVPEGHYFFMGDNRDNSADSRFSELRDGVGFVPAENLVGKAQFILFSWNSRNDHTLPEGTPTVSLFKPWTWFTAARPGRFFQSLN